MKRLMFGLILFVTLAIPQPVDNFPIIRKVSEGPYMEYSNLYVRKFQDGPNTCYVVHSYSYGNGKTVAISCVK